MIPKMIRLALVLLAVLVMALEFPKIYKKALHHLLIEPSSLTI